YSGQSSPASLDRSLRDHGTRKQSSAIRSGPVSDGIHSGVLLSSRSVPGRPAHAARESTATRSCGDEKPFDLRNLFTVVYTIGERPQRQGFDLPSCFLARLAISHDARQSRDLGDPAAVLLALELDS